MPIKLQSFVKKKKTLKYDRAKYDRKQTEPGLYV